MVLSTTFYILVLHFLFYFLFFFFFFNVLMDHLPDVTFYIKLKKYYHYKVWLLYHYYYYYSTLMAMKIRIDLPLLFSKYIEHIYGMYKIEYTNTFIQIKTTWIKKKKKTFFYFSSIKVFFLFLHYSLSLRMKLNDKVTLMRIGW